MQNFFKYTKEKEGIAEKVLKTASIFVLFISAILSVWLVMN